MSENTMLTKKSVRNRSAVGRLGYSYKPILSNPILEPTAPTTTTKPNPHVVKTVGRANVQESIIPIASLFSSTDLVQPPTTSNKRPPSAQTRLRRSVSMHQAEPETESVPM